MHKSTQEDINALGYSSLAEGLQANFKRVEELMQNFASSYEHVDYDPFHLAEAYSEWLTAIASDPQKVMEANMKYWSHAISLYQESMKGFLGGDADQVITEEKGDRRFRHEGWAEEPVFNTIKQSYLMVSDWMRNLVSDVDGLDPHTAEKVRFFTERYLDAMSPTNFALTNPAVIEKAVETKGANLVHGLKNMLTDLESGNGQLQIRMTETEAFELGENVAVTPGKVIFQNRMFQLIQYTPTTEKVLKRPLLVIPPWINKFYIMDLQPKNSLLAWLVSQGHTVFVVSWVNPDESYKDTTFTDYIHEGVITAVDKVEEVTGESAINAIGYCIGGTLLTTTLAYMKAKGDERIKSATFFTTMLDFEDPGELGVFIDEDQIAGLEKKMEEDGYLDGCSMAGAFNLLRANDLIWSFYINNYLLGNDPRPFDLLYWNSDSTRMPAKMHSWYLRNLYVKNLLKKPGGITIDDVAIDISTIDIPTCFVSTVDDHIAPWKSTYAGASLFSGDVRFILGGSGHIAGVINPPAAGKYDYRVIDGLVDDPQAWADEAEKHQGSWWPEWQKWVQPLSGSQVTARKPGTGKFKAIEDAPGSYVKVRISDQKDAVSVSPSTEPVAKGTKAEVETAKTAETPATSAVAGKVRQSTAKVAVKKKPETKSKSSKASNQKLNADNLTLIEGIGPAISKLLVKEGISSFANLAATKVDKISAILKAAGSRYQMHDPSSWPEQSAMAKDGRFDELKKWQDTHKGGKK